MPQVQGGGTVYGIGPGTNLRGPLALKRMPCAANGSIIDFVGLFDANGAPVAPTATGGIVIPSANLDPQLLQYKKVPLTAANIKALNGTPQTVIAAPGAGKYINLIDAALNVTFGSAQYTAGSEIDLKLGAIIIAKTTAALLNAVAANASLGLSFPGLATPQTNGPDNVALILSAASTEFATGDSTANLHLWYQIVNG